MYLLKTYKRNFIQRLIHKHENVDCLEIGDYKIGTCFTCVCSKCGYGTMIREAMGMSLCDELTPQEFAEARKIQLKNINRGIPVTGNSDSKYFSTQNTVEQKDVKEESNEN